jgi:dTDP-4-dehydrorhamnose 3,5-epimerase
MGRALRRLLSGGLFRDRAALDVTDRSSVAAALAGVDVVIHLAAVTDVDLCEREPELADRINVEGTRNVVVAAADAGARLVFFSTDQVFDGTSSGEYAEGDPVAPLNVYGRTKVAAEDLVRAAPESLVVRTSWLIGEGRNFVNIMLDAARREGSVRVVGDQRGRPSFAADVGEAVVHAIDQSISGTIHLAGDGRPCTRAELAEAIFAATGVITPVERVSTAEFMESSGSVIAPRPANATLSIERARSFGVPLHDWRGSLEAYLGAGG